MGHFPNSGNPHRITPQDYNFKVTINPKKIYPKGKKAPMNLNIGVALNGVPFDPGAAEWYRGLRNSKWQYEALSGAVALGVDEHYAHVQPTGAYHYHGIPKAFISSKEEVKIIGWAADGFPIYLFYNSNP